MPHVDNPHLAPNCPRCSKPLVYRTTGIGSRSRGGAMIGPEEVKQYFCEQHGLYALWPDGTLRYTPSSYRPTELADLE